MKPKPAAIGGMPGGHTSNLMQLYLYGYDASALRDEGDRAFIMYIHDGSSKVLFPLLALNRNSMRDAFCFTCKKVKLKIQVNCSKSTSLEKKWFVSCKKS